MDLAELIELKKREKARRESLKKENILTRDNKLYIPMKLLNFEDSHSNICMVEESYVTCRPRFESSGFRVNPNDYREEWKKYFRSPLYELMVKLEWSQPGNVEELVFFGEETKADLTWWNSTYEFDCRQYPCIHKYNSYKTHKIVRFESAITDLYLNGKWTFEDKPIYINNFIDNITIYGNDEDSKKRIFFRAPKPNEELADGKLVKLTEAYSNWSRRYSYDYFWSKPITLHSSAVTYIEEIELDCYESHQHKGTRLYFIGIVPKELTEEEKRRFVEGYPYVDVWESPEFVVEKLKQAGWGK